MDIRARLRNFIMMFIEKLNTAQKRTIWYLIDAFVFLAGTIISYYIFVNIIRLPRTYYVIYTLLAFIIYFFTTSLTKLSSRIKRYTSFSDIISLFTITVFSSLISSFMCFVAFDVRTIRFAGTVALFTALGIVSIRFLWQTIYIKREEVVKLGDQDIENVILIGAGDGGSVFMRSYSRRATNFKVVAILDQDPGKHGLNIDGINVAGDLDLLPDLVKLHNVKRVIIAIPSLSPENYENIIKLCNQLNVKVYNMPKVEDVLLGLNQNTSPMRKINIADLLGRKEVELDESKMRAELEGKTILITGAGGSIGSEISRQVSKFNPEKVLLLGHGENSIYLIYQEHVRNKNTMTQYVPLIADIQDYDRIVNIFKEEKPDIVYHAAAHKHVPLMEVNPVETYTNNILGTYNIARAVDEAKVPKMVMISTDKAVRPPNVMGASKRVAELIVTGMNKISDSTYCAVRFGNVLGSRGSVVPAFEKMIAEGGPVKVTDFRMTRYFMTIPEASRLVIYAGSHSKGGEVFILNMGEPVKILDLARKMILLKGFTEEEIGIEESGIRQGEKLYEELLTSSELIDDQIDENIFIGNVAAMSLEEIDVFLEGLEDIKHNKRQLKETIIQFANKTTQE